MAVAVAGMGICATDKAWWMGLMSCTAIASVFWLMQWRSGTLSMRQVLGWAIVFRLMLVPLGPSLSDDYFRYIWDGVVQVNGANPYALIPEDETFANLHDGAVYDRLNSKTYYSVYPPVSQAIFAVGGLAYPLGWPFSYYLIKLILVGFEIGGLFLLARMVSAQAAMLYAWCPLVLMEAAGQAHTEALMVFFLFLCLWALRAGHNRWAVAALTGAGLVKLYPLVLVPFLLNRVGWKYVWVAVATGLAIALPYAHPEALAHVRESLNLYVQRFEFNAGPYYFLKWAFEHYTEVRRPGSAAGPILQGLFLGGLGVLFVVDAYRSWFSKPVAALSKVIFVILAAYLALATTIHPWYFLGLFAMLPFLNRMPCAWVWLGLLSMGTYLFYPYGRLVYLWVVALAWVGWVALMVVDFAERSS